jgi:hypothetical protein
VHRRAARFTTRNHLPLRRHNPGQGTPARTDRTAPAE